MTCTLSCFMTSTDISKLSRYDMDTLIESEIKINGKKTSFERVLEISSMISAILDRLIEFISTKKQEVLYKEIVLKTKPAKSDDLEITVAIPESFKHLYQVKIVGDIIYIYDKYEKLTVTISPKKNLLNI